MTLVEKLVRCYSPAGAEGPLAALLVEEMRARGFNAGLDEAGNAVGTVGDGPKRVYLLGHMDTVPGELPVRLEDGQLYGRGSVDAKGALAAFVEAASAFVRSPVLRLTVIGCVEEEADSRGARHVVSRYDPPDFAVVGEPSGWQGITLGYKGSLQLRYRLRQPRAHRGAPQATPAEEAVAFYRTLCTAYPQGEPGFTALALRLVRFNTAEDGCHESVDVELNVRTPPAFDLEAFRRLVAQAQGEAHVAWGPYTPPVLSDKRNVLVRAFLSAIRAQGGRPRFKRKTGTSDMNWFQTWGCPLVAYGPGDSALDHTPYEHLALAEYARAIAVLRGALRQLEQSGQGS